MSARLTTPTGRPASSMTGAALKPCSVSISMASRTVALARIDIGLGIIKSAAVSAQRVSPGEAAFVVGAMIDLLGKGQRTVVKVVTFSGANAMPPARDASQ